MKFLTVLLFFISFSMIFSQPQIPIGNLNSFSETPIFSNDGGFYANEISVALNSNSENTDIYYTTDGSEPTTNSIKYSIPILVDETKVIRARFYGGGTIASKVTTHTYFINETSTLPVFSISTNPKNLWNDFIGIYVIGKNGIEGDCEEIANYNQNWERPINFSMFNSNGLLNFNMEAGVQIYGGCSRRQNQKSLKILARSKYGNERINFSFFKKRPFDSFKRILLRNSGNENPGTFFRDALMHSLVEELDLETQAYQPSIVFLNGEYWGIHNIRERIDKYYVGQHGDVDVNYIDLLGNTNDIIEGDNSHYENLFNFIRDNDLSEQSNYEFVTTQMEIDNYIDYMLSQIYFVNVDWFPGNIKFWRPKNTEGKWRWILYDTDWGFGFDYPNQEKVNMLEFVKNDEKYSSVFFKGLLNNEIFKIKFINRFSDLAISIFRKEVVTSKIDSIKNLIQNEIGRHLGKWGGSYSEWEAEIDTMKYFANHRISFMQNNFVNEFELEGIAKLNLSTNNPNSGEVEINKIGVKDFPWSGEYFKGIPITIKAISKIGYKFLNWIEDSVIVSSDSIYTFMPNSSNNLVANFQSPTGDIETQNEIIDEFYLSQNFPNPFNPSTTISFGVPQKSNVRLEVFNTLGRLVRTITNKYYSPGQYAITWNGKDNFGKKVNSGIYIYRFSSNNFIDSKRMILLK